MQTTPTAPPHHIEKMGAKLKKKQNCTSFRLRPVAAAALKRARADNPGVTASAIISAALVMFSGSHPKDQKTHIKLVVKGDDW